MLFNVKINGSFSFSYPHKLYKLPFSSSFFMYKPSAWDLSEIKPNSITFQQIERFTAAFESKRKLLTSTVAPATFLQLVKELEVLLRNAEKLAAYSQLHFSENANNQQAAAFLSQTQTFLTKIQNRLLFFRLWFKLLPEKKAQELIKASGKYHYYFEFLRKTRKYTLKENEEKIINIKDSTGFAALTNVYNLLTSQFEFFFQGQKRTQEEMVTFVRSADPQIRKEAYHTLLAPYKKQKDVIGEIYKNIINDWREEHLHLRGYKSPISVRNLANDLPDEAVEVILRVCEKNQPLFHKFFEIKRKRLKLKKLQRYDLYAPLEEKKDTIPYDKAVDMVLTSFRDFSPQFQDIARKIIAAQHVHSLVQPGKRSGAFCASATTTCSSFVLLSYTGKYRDVSTLAHELGHAIHYSLASKQTEFTHEACLPLAETASIFSEMLLSERMMAQNPKAAQKMLFTKIEDLYASIIRQAGFVRFEQKAHKMMEEGKTIDEMSAVYLADLKKQLGPKVAVDDIFAHEWCYIPHIFYTPFYCYAYAFGNLLTLALWEMYKEKGESFVPRIIDLLSHGGSEAPLVITRAVGVDITSEAFWQKGFDAVERIIKELDRQWS